LTPVEPDEPTPAARMPSSAAEAPAPSGPEWLALLTSIKRDVENLRADRSGAAPVANAPPDAEQEAPEGAPQQAAATPATSAERGRRKKKKAAPPPQDEWGFFDPEQCGFAALLAKLDEITEEEPQPTKRSKSK
jgi:hypothetical protein